MVSLEDCSGAVAELRRCTDNTISELSSYLSSFDASELMRFSISEERQATHKENCKGFYIKLGNSFSEISFAMTGISHLLLRASREGELTVLEFSADIFEAYRCLEHDFSVYCTELRRVSAGSEKKISVPKLLGASQKFNGAIREFKRHLETESRGI